MTASSRTPSTPHRQLLRYRRDQHVGSDVYHIGGCSNSSLSSPDWARGVSSAHQRNLFVCLFYLDGSISVLCFSITVFQYTRKVTRSHPHLPRRRPAASINIRGNSSTALLNDRHRTSVETGPQVQDPHKVVSLWCPRWSRPRRCFPFVIKQVSHLVHRRVHILKTRVGERPHRAFLHGRTPLFVPRAVFVPMDLQGSRVVAAVVPDRLNHSGEPALGLKRKPSFMGRLASQRLHPQQLAHRLRIARQQLQLAAECGTLTNQLRHTPLLRLVRWIFPPIHPPDGRQQCVG